MPHLPDHVTHDPELIAAYAAGDATGPALDQAADLVAACTECADLHRDLRAISTALPELPAPVRPRDFRLTPEQAASLRPVGWRGVLAAFAAPRFRLAAPLGAGLAAAGLAGLLLASPGALLPGAASGEATTGSAPSAAAAPAAQGDQPSAAAGAAAVGAQPAEGASTDPERLYLGVDAAKASAAASAGLAPLPQPGAFAPDASAPAASAMPDTVTALGTAPVAGVEGSGNQAAPSAARIDVGRPAGAGRRSRAGTGGPHRRGAGGGRVRGERDPGHPRRREHPARRRPDADRAPSRRPSSGLSSAAPTGAVAPAARPLPRSARRRWWRPARRRC